MVVGSQTALLSCDVQADTCADLHLGNLAISIPGIESQTMDDFMDFFLNPDCFPVITRDSSKDTKFLPKYLVPPISILEICIDIFKSIPGHAICVKIMDFGNGLLFGYPDF
jgi:hypothetical protein